MSESRGSHLMIRRIVVAVDASPHSQAALEAAIDMASRFEAELLALFVTRMISMCCGQRVSRSLTKLASTRPCGEGGALQDRAESTSPVAANRRGVSGAGSPGFSPRTVPGCARQREDRDRTQRRKRMS